CKAGRDSANFRGWPKLRRLLPTLHSAMPRLCPMWCCLSAKRRLNEAAGHARISGSPALGRPTCRALPASLQARSVLSLGCIGNRVYTDLGEDEFYFVVRAKDLSALADALNVITGANKALRDYAQRRRTELTSA